MFGFSPRSELQQCQERLYKSEQLLAAIRQSMAVIEFTPQGEIVDANAAFLGVVGYSLDEVRGRHHRIFCSQEMLNRPDYSQFWRRLAQGESFSDRFMRRTKDGAGSLAGSQLHASARCCRSRRSGGQDSH